MRSPVSTALFDQFANGWRGYVLIVLIALASASFGLGRMPVTDLGEARIAQGTREMIEQGDAAPPVAPGVHWLQGAAVRAAEPLTHQLNTIWPYRLPSALGLALAAAASLWGGTALIGARAAFIGAGLFASTVLAGAVGMLAGPDALLAGFTTLAIAALARLRLGLGADGPRAVALVFWTALGASLLVGGLAGPLVVVLAVAVLAAWERRAGWLRPLLWWPALIMAAALAALWFVAAGGAMFSATPSAPSDDTGLLGHHIFMLPFLIFPACYALPAATRFAWEGVRGEKAGAIRFLIAWALPLFVVFELAPARAPQDVLPAYPAISLLCGAGMAAMRGRAWRTAHPAGLALFAVAGVVIVLLTAASATFMPGDLIADLRRAVSAALINGGVLGIAFAALLMLRRAAARAAVLIACALVFSFSVRERLAPEARELHVSSEAAAALARTRLTPTDNRPLWVVGYDAASIVFETSSSIRVSVAHSAGAQAQAGDAMIVESRMLQDVAAELTLRGLAFDMPEPPVRGLSLANGERVALFVGEVETANAEAADAPPQNP